VNNEEHKFRQAVSDAVKMAISPNGVYPNYTTENDRLAVRWDEDHAQWKATMESIHNMDAWFYVRVGELAEGESPRDSVSTNSIYVRFVVPTKMAQDNWKKPKWHSDKVRIYLRSYLHKKGYDFHAPYNLAVKRTK
jgi:hypothetical protein